MLRQGGVQRGKLRRSRNARRVLQPGLLPDILVRPRHPLALPHQDHRDTNPVRMDHHDQADGGGIPNRGERVAGSAGIATDAEVRQVDAIA